MQIFTFRLKPKQLFGAALAITGLIVIILTFLSNHNGKPASVNADISCASEEERRGYLKGLGYTFDGDVKTKKITVPSEFNEVYEKYNGIQKEQGFDLEAYKGKEAVLYTYNITNYNDNENVIADLLVSDGVLIGADLCDPSAEDGFLTALKENGKT